VQKQVAELLVQNQQLLEYIGELVTCLGQAKSISLNHLVGCAAAPQVNASLTLHEDCC